MRLKVIELRLFGEHNNNDVVCLDEEGRRHTVDFIVDGSLPEDIEPKHLIGKTIEVSYLSPYIEIAHECRIVEEIANA